MTISFKISRTGTRYQPKPVSRSTNGTTFSIGAGEEERMDAAARVPSQEKESDLSSFANQKPPLTSIKTTTFSLGAGEEELIDAAARVQLQEKGSDLNSFATRKSPLTGDTSNNKCLAETEIPDDQISFTFNVFDNGFSIGKSLEIPVAGQTSISTSKSLRAYTRAAKYLFSAMECGRIPVDIVDDLPCKYVEGEIFCEVRDYRSRTSEGQLIVVSGDGSPVINRACLKMSHDLVVKDMQAMVGDHWTYGDFLEVESRILEHLWPRLFLDPKQERLFESPVPTKLNLGLCNMLPKKPSDSPEVAESSNYTSKGKQICSDRVSDSSSLGQLESLLLQLASEDVNLQIDVEGTMSLQRNSSFDGSLLVSPPVSHLSTYHVGTGSSRVMEGDRSASPDTVSIPCQRDNLVGQSSPPFTKEKARIMHTEADGNQRHLGHQMENLHEPDFQMKRALMKEQLIARGMQYLSNDMQSFYPQAFLGDLNPETSALPSTFGQQGAECNSLDLGEMQRFDQPEHGRIHMVDSEITTNNSQTSLLQQYMSQKITRSSSPQNPCNNIDQPHDDKARKQNSSKKRKSIQARASAGCLPKSPLSSRSGELTGSVGPQYGAVVTSELMSSQQEKSAIISISSAGVAIEPCFADSAAQHQNRAQAAAIHISNSLPLVPSVSGVGSPAAFDNRRLLENANGPLVGTQPLGDPAVLDSFSKIKIATSRYQPNHKRFKGDEYFIRNPNAYFSGQLVDHLSSNSKNENTEGIICEMPLSKSLVGGNMNVCKIRSLDFSQIEGTVEGSDDQFFPKDKIRMIMSEKPYDGAVAIHLGEIEEADYLAAEDYLPTLPNTHMGDLLAAQLCSLMEHDGYYVEDHLRPRPVQANHSSITQLNAPIIPQLDATAEIQQFPEGVSCQQSNDIAKYSISDNATANSSQSIPVPQMLPLGDAQPSQALQRFLPGFSVISRTQKPEMPSLQQNLLMGQQIPQFQRPSPYASNSMHHVNNVARSANIQLGAHMASNSSSLQPQLFQQQHQQQQQLFQSQQMPPPPQKQKNSISSLSTSVGMGYTSANTIRFRGLGTGTGIGDGSGVTGTGFSSPMSPISNIGNTYQSPINLSSASNINSDLHSGTLTPDQAAFMRLKTAQTRSNTLGGMPRAPPTYPGSTGLPVPVPALNQMQHTGTGVMPGMHLNLNEHHQKILQNLMRMKQQQQQQHVILHQETTPTLQAFTPPQHMGVSHQMNHPFQQQLPQQQMSQGTQMSAQPSSGAVHQFGATNPRSFSSSSQLLPSLGSVGGTTHSLMNSQGGNYSNPANNAFSRLS